MFITKLETGMLDTVMEKADMIVEDYGLVTAN